MIPRQLLAHAEARRVGAASRLDDKSRSALGQFFTPGRAASLIAAIPRLPREGQLRILDPGAGSGSLTAAIVARILSESPQLDVEVVGVETDPTVAGYLRDTFEDCKDAARSSGMSLDASVIEGDFIDLATGLLASEPLLSRPFDLVIMNPPYLKLGARSSHRLAVAAIGADCPNLYAAFLAVGVEVLRDGGQLAAITPRSFANGPYFGSFRRFLLDRLALDAIHTFQSRSTVFADTGVLQENIVFSGTRVGKRSHVTIAISAGHHDVAVVRTVPYNEVVRPGDPHKFVRVFANDKDQEAADSMALIPCTLSGIGLSVSTGRVVDFRVRDLLRNEMDEATVPLVYPGNIRGGIVEWPREIRKPQALDVSDEVRAAKRVMPNGYYVLAKRFSAKEERRRIVAGVWDPTGHAAKTVAFENHLNVFHRSGAGLDRFLAIGLSYWLNSTLVDRFFRTFSGHTQVNATDLRTLRFPSDDEMRALGARFDPRLPDQDTLDEIVAGHFEL
ncbi:MAG: Eco57I restriction-modification methylase domain-containing protein [Candidatus Nanopelagicales bacterium]|nr:Eco57I restriction-modification methylase domain-containing protein [Candidatus Nanopelagicales bacterium]